MSILVHYSAPIRARLGVASAKIDCDHVCSVADVLQEVGERHGAEVEGVLLDGQRAIVPSIMVCVNDKQVLDIDRHLLSDGDEVLLISAISGG